MIVKATLSPTGALVLSTDFMTCRSDSVKAETETEALLLVVLDSVSFHVIPALFVPVEFTVAVIFKTNEAPFAMLPIAQTPFAAS